MPPNSMGKGLSFQQMVLIQLVNDMLKNEPQYFLPIINKYSKWIITLKLRAHTIKLLEENTGEKY